MQRKELQVFKKKPIYMLLLIVFTLLLCADVAAYMLTAGGEAETPGNMPNREDFDPSQMQGDFEGQRPDMSGEDFDPSQMQGDFEGQRPDMSDEGFDPSQMNGGTGRGENTAESGSGFAGFIGTWWIPIGIFCVVIDAIFIWMLIRISKKRRQKDGGIPEQEEQAKPVTDSKTKISSYEKRQRKKRRTMWIIGSILVVILLIIAGFLIVQGAYQAQLVQAESVTVVSAEASGTKIDTVISGTGTLEEETAEALTIPDGVEIAEYDVENGDTVEEGDVLAVVDHTSVMKTIAEVQDAMNQLDEDINEAADEDIESTVEAASDGRVKAVYAQEGVDVSKTMYEYGALMLVSLDGLMAADIETDADMAAGDSVVILLADGTATEGRVDSAVNGVVTVTVTDDGTELGEEVKVSDENGNVIGSASLYIHSELKVTGYAGTVSRIKAYENDVIDAGDTLIKLSDTEYTANYELLINQRREYEDVMMTLFTLYQDGNIYAEFSGTVAGIDEKNAAEYTAASSTGVSSGNTQTSQTGMLSLSESTVALVYKPAEQTLAASESGADSIIALGSNPGGVDDTTAAAYSNYAGIVTDVTYGSFVLNGCYVGVPVTDYANYEALGITTEMMTEQKQASPAASTPVYMFENGAWVQYTMNDISTGDVLVLTYDNSSETPSLVWIVIADKAEADEEQPGEQHGQGGSGSGSGGGSAAPSGSDQETVSEEEAYELRDTTVMSITPLEKMKVTFTIDELDILALQIGQEAMITLDAIDGETLSGVVTDIDMAGTSSGGNTKYTAVVTLDKTDQMIAGMNAAVSITISSKQCDVAIPIAAIVESGNESYVYTSYNEEKHAFGGLAAVSTGLSDGADVEILSGLDAGSKVWYEYNDSVNISSSVINSSGSGRFDIMRMLGGR